MPALNNYTDERAGNGDYGCCGAESAGADGCGNVCYGNRRNGNGENYDRNYSGRGNSGRSSGYGNYDRGGYGRGDSEYGRRGADRGHEHHGGYGERDGGSYRGRNSRNDDFYFEIVERYGVVAISSSGWSKELNRVSWNGNAPKLDFREWSPDHAKMHRGVTFTDEEALELRELIDIALRGEEGQILRAFKDDEPSYSSGPLIGDDGDVGNECAPAGNLSLFDDNSDCEESAEAAESVDASKTEV